MSGHNPFLRDGSDGFFDPAEEFIPEHLPDPIPFLTDADILFGDEHVSFHQIAEEVFEARGVYDMTFGYNLARLNLDQRHPDAGYRYAREREHPEVIRAGFTPTTPFCPQAHTLVLGSFRAWNGLREEYDYELVRIRLDDMHHNSSEINEQLERMETGFIETGEIQPSEDTVPEERPKDQSSRTPF